LHPFFQLACIVDAFPAYEDTNDYSYSQQRLAWFSSTVFQYFCHTVAHQRANLCTNPLAMGVGAARWPYLDE
jgi:hypothetical protein